MEKCHVSSREPRKEDLVHPPPGRWFQRAKFKRKEKDPLWYNQLSIIFRSAGDQFFHKYMMMIMSSSKTTVFPFFGTSVARLFVLLCIPVAVVLLRVPRAYSWSALSALESPCLRLSPGAGGRRWAWCAGPHPAAAGPGAGGSRSSTASPWCSDGGSRAPSPSRSSSAGCTGGAGRPRRCPLQQTNLWVGGR